MYGLVRNYNLTKVCSLRIARHFAVGSPKHVEVVESRARTPQSKFSCDIISGNHTIVSDLTKLADGNDLGPSPKELLMSALGSCTAMTIRTVYENSKALAERNQHDTVSSRNGLGGWAGSTLDEIRVKVEESGSHPHVPDKLTIRIELKGKLTAEQKGTLLKASSNCPVKTMLTKGVGVESAII